MKLKNVLAVALGSLVVFALSLPVMAQSTTESTDHDDAGSASGADAKHHPRLRRHQQPSRQFRPRRPPIPPRIRQASQGETVRLDHHHDDASGRADEADRYGKTTTTTPAPEVKKETTTTTTTTPPPQN